VIEAANGPRELVADEVGHESFDRHVADQIAHQHQAAR
jgi:hypothetical protein